MDQPAERRPGQRSGPLPRPNKTCTTISNTFNKQFATRGNTLYLAPSPLPANHTKWLGTVQRRLKRRESESRRRGYVDYSCVQAVSFVRPRAQEIRSPTYTHTHVCLALCSRGSQVKQTAAERGAPPVRVEIYSLPNISSSAAVVQTTTGSSGFLNRHANLDHSPDLSTYRGVKYKYDIYHGV